MVQEISNFHKTICGIRLTRHIDRPKAFSLPTIQMCRMSHITYVNVFTSEAIQGMLS